MNLQEICEETVADMEGCLGCAVVDLTNGLPLATKVATASVVGQDALELLAAASVEYFRGPMMWQLQLAISNGQPDVNFAHEIQTTTEDTYNFMSVVPRRENIVLVLILDRATNLGLGRIAMRQVLQRLSGPDDNSEDAERAEPLSPTVQVAMSSAFAHTPNRTNSIGQPGAQSDAAQSTHVPYRDASAADELNADNARHLNPAPTVREWRGGLGGRKQHH